MVLTYVLDPTLSERGYGQPKRGPLGEKSFGHSATLAICVRIAGV